MSFFFSSGRRHTRSKRDWSSDVCSSDLVKRVVDGLVVETLDRDVLATAQTPQAIRMGLLRAAWDSFPADGSATFTDEAGLDRKSTRLNSSHVSISYAVFCLKKKNQTLST